MARTQPTSVTFHMANPPVIDPAAIDNLRSLDEDGQDTFLREIIGIFLEDMPQRLAELRLSHGEADGPRFTRVAHTIKGSASNLGAERVRLLAEQLEHTSKANGLAGLDGDIARLEMDFAQARDELLKLLG